jgi:hypothetical protein
MSTAADRERMTIVSLSDQALLRLHRELEARRPGAPKPAVGVRPRRRPWTYREIWWLDATREEIKWRGL